jgi:hypothetical protein
MRVHALGLEAGLRSQSLEDQKSPRAGEGAALCVQEKLRPVSAVEVRAAVCQVAPERLHGVRSERHDALLVALADRTDERRVEVDAGAIESDGLADAKPRSVQKLDEGTVSPGARRRPVGGLDEALDLTRGERSRQLSAAFR